MKALGRREKGKEILSPKLRWRGFVEGVRRVSPTGGGRGGRGRPDFFSSRKIKDPPKRVGEE